MLFEGLTEVLVLEKLPCVYVGITVPISSCVWFMPVAHYGGINRGMLAGNRACLLRSVPVLTIMNRVINSMKEEGLPDESIYLLLGELALMWKHFFE